MHHWNWLYSIRVKLAVATSLIIAVISGFIYWFFPSRLEQQAIEALSEKANMVAVMTAYNIAPAMEFDDRNFVRAILQNAKQNRDLDYVMVLDDSGKIIATLDSACAIRLNYGDVDFAEKISVDRLTFQTVAPIIANSTVHGRVYIGHTLKPLLGEIAKTRRTIAWVSFVIGVLGMLCMVLFSTVLVAPLAKVARVAEEIASGNLKRRARVSSRDEVGILADAFDKMVGHLELAYDDLRMSEKNYRELFASNPHPMWVFDLDTRKFIDVNEAAVENYGYTRNEFLGMIVHDIIVGGPFGSIDELFGLQTNLYRSTGWRHLKKDGTIGDFEMSSHSLPFRNGRRSRLVLASDITKRIRSEALLRESEERYRDLFENSRELIQSTGADFHFQFVNRAWMETLGYAKDEVSRLGIFDVIKKEDQGHCRRVLRDVFDGKSVDGMQTTFIGKDGREVVVEGSVSAKFENGTMVSTRGIFRDITERKRAEETILLQKTRFEQLFENAPVGFVLTDSAERIIHANRTFQGMFGYSDAELSGQDLNRMIVAEEKLSEAREYSRRVFAGESVKCEGVRQRKDGQSIDVEAFGVRINVKGVSNGMIGIYVDATARKKTEREIALLAHALACTRDCVSVTDLEDNIIFVNDAFLACYGYTREELLGKPIALLRAPTVDSDVVEQILPETVAGGWHGEVVNCRNDGSEFEIDLWTSVIPNEQGEPIAAIGVARDITERKRAEQQRAQLMRQLEASNRELNDFAYIVSHDLKAPLRAIGSLANWLVTDFGDRLGEEGNEMLRLLLGRTTRMHDLIEGILKYSRIGRTKEEVVPIDLDRIVPEIVEMVAPPQHCEVKIQHPLPMIMGESTRVQQVFQNVLSNAIKFIDKPRGIVEVGCVREDGHWKFSVADNGPGIEERHFTRIFQIFQTLTARDAFESTGIGLTIVKKVVEMHGGRVWLESRMGRGTTFYFTFPARSENARSGSGLNGEDDGDRYVDA